MRNQGEKVVAPKEFPMKDIILSDGDTKASTRALSSINFSEKY
jgi:hypothetical protein